MLVTLSNTTTRYSYGPTTSFPKHRNCRNLRLIVRTASIVSRRHVDEAAFQHKNDQKLLAMSYTSQAKEGTSYLLRSRRGILLTLTRERGLRCGLGEEC